MTNVFVVCMHAHVCVYVIKRRVCMHACVHVHVCMQACVHVFDKMNVSVCLSTPGSYEMGFYNLLLLLFISGGNHHG